jgi:hypothetical protein
MKKSIILICFAIIMTYGKADPTHPYTGNEKIEIQGKLDINAGPDDLEVYIDDQTVYVYFNQDFGSVNVSLYGDMSGLIYSTVVNTSMQHLLVIPITSSSNNNYTILFSNTFGYAEGEFDREP